MPAVFCLRGFPGISGHFRRHNGALPRNFHVDTVQRYRTLVELEDVFPPGWDIQKFFGLINALLLGRCLFFFPAFLLQVWDRHQSIVLYFPEGRTDNRGSASSHAHRICGTVMARASGPFWKTSASIVFKIAGS